MTADDLLKSGDEIRLYQCRSLVDSLRHEVDKSFDRADWKEIDRLAKKLKSMVAGHFCKEISEQLRNRDPVT